MARNINLIGCIRVVATGACENITFINSSGQTGSPAQNGWTIINDARYIPNDFASATASAPTYVTGLYNVYKGDCSAGDAYFEVDTVAMRGCSFTIKCIGAGNDFIISTKSGTGLFETAATPYTLTPTLLKAYTIWCDGTDLFIIGTT